MIKMLDKDGDGRLSLTELRPLADRLSKAEQQANEKYEGGTDLAQEMSARDVNHDGYLELNEIAVVPIGNPPVWTPCIQTR